MNTQRPECNDANDAVAGYGLSMVTLYHLVSFPTADAAEVHPLPPMLEGQVAVLGTTGLEDTEAVARVGSLFDSPLYRADQDSFLLHPAASRPSFLDRNHLPTEVLDEKPALRRPVESEGRPILRRDVDGGLHFRADPHHAQALERALAPTDLDVAERATVHEVYEQLFHHHAFTGRSGGMHGYEGIGSISWHMVAKLLLAVQERSIEVATHGGDPAIADRLERAYRRIRDGGLTLSRPMLPPEELWWTDDGGAAGYRFTVCATPIPVVRGDADRVRIIRDDGAEVERSGRTLTREESAEIFDRRGTIAAVEFRTA